jgi:hypothetical protein
MSNRIEVLSRFSGEGGGAPLYLPDLTLWYDWHQRRGTLPSEWQDLSLSLIARTMGVPLWLPIRPWQVEVHGAEIVTTEQDGERVVRSETSAGPLVARWIVGPDGDWWQTEYPVKSAEDLASALELVRARSYALDASELARLEAVVGDDGMLALEIPRRPYSDLLHELLGWSEGLMLFGHPIVDEIMVALENKLQHLVRQVAQLPGEVVFSPDNLDGQFVSPRAFKRNLADSYQRTAEVLHAGGKRLMVHVGGPVRHLLASLAAMGVDGLEGIAGPPQSNATLAEAREIGGPGLTLWGGIPQDFLLNTYDRTTFEAAVGQAAHEARGDGRMILGVADRVPVNAELDRLKSIPSLVEQGS